MNDRMTNRLILVAIIILAALWTHRACAGPPSATRAGWFAARGAGLETPTTEGLVAYWAMRESGGTAFDEQGDNDGTATNVTFGTAYGVREDGGEFNGSNGYINVSHSAALDITSDMTLTAWIKISTNTRGGIIDKSQGGVGFAFSFIYFPTASLGGTEKTVNYYSPSTGWGGANVSLAVDRFYFVAAVIDADSGVDFYIDGNHAGRKNDSTSSPSSAALDLKIGCDYLNNYFDGSIDEVRIYNRALTADEITTLYNWDKEGSGHE